LLLPFITSPCSDGTHKTCYDAKQLVRSIKCSTFCYFCDITAAQLIPMNNNVSALDKAKVCVTGECNTKVFLTAATTPALHAYYCGDCVPLKCKAQGPQLQDQNLSNVAFGECNGAGTFRCLVKKARSDITSSDCTVGGNPGFLSPRPFVLPS
jgi:hypothetical protein